MDWEHLSKRMILMFQENMVTTWCCCCCCCCCRRLLPPFLYVSDFGFRPNKNSFTRSHRSLEPLLLALVCVESKRASYSKLHSIETFLSACVKFLKDLKYIFGNKYLLQSINPSGFWSFPLLMGDFFLKLCDQKGLTLSHRSMVGNRQPT